MINYKLKKFTMEDYEFVYEFKKNAYIKYVEENWGKWNDDVQRDLFKKFIETNKDNISIIYLDGTKIGFYQGFELEDGGYEIGNICIAPEHQGKGIGTKILEDALTNNRNKDIHLQFFKQNKVGKLYERLGFVLSGETEYHYQMTKYAKNKGLK